MGSSAAIGAAVAYDDLGGNPANPASTTQNSVTASIANVTGGITASQILVQTSSTAQINNISFGGAGAGTFALGGAVSVNTIRDDTESSISGSSGIRATSTVSPAIQVLATDSSTIQAAAGGIGIAVAGQSAVAATVGASAAANNVYDTTSADVTGSQLTSTGGLSIKATATPTIKTLTVGGAVQ